MELPLKSSVFNCVGSRNRFKINALFFVSGAALFLLLCMGCINVDMIRIQNIVKSDVDMITDMHLREITELMKQFTIKLYKRNPNELAKSALPGLNKSLISTFTASISPPEEAVAFNEALKERLDILYSCPVSMGYPETEHKVGVDAMLLSFKEEFKGDRVFTMMFGLYSMVISAYNNRCELFILDQLDQQKFYNSARNIEILAWRIKSRRNSSDQPFLLTNETKGEVLNLSFERLLGKMISIQDMMAYIVADSSNRLINKVVHTAGMAFLPLKL